MAVLCVVGRWGGQAVQGRAWKIQEGVWLGVVSKTVHDGWEYKRQNFACSPFYVESVITLFPPKNRPFYISIQLRSLELLTAIQQLSGFPDSSVCKESAYNAGDPSSIPEPGRFSGEGIGYPLQDSWAYLVAQLVKSPPAMQETWV